MTEKILATKRVCKFSATNQHHIANIITQILYCYFREVLTYARNALFDENVKYVLNNSFCIELTNYTTKTMNLNLRPCFSGFKYWLHFISGPFLYHCIHCRAKRNNIS